MEGGMKGEKKLPLEGDKKGKRKWLSRFFNFLMYGGWLLILVFIVGFITLISVLTK